MRKTIEVIATSKNSTKIQAASPAINFHSHSVSFFYFLFSSFQFKRKKRYKRKGSNKVKTLRRLVIFPIHNTNKYYVCISVSCNFCAAPIWLSDSLFLGLEMLASCSPSDDCLVLMFQIFTNSQFENHTS